MLHRNTSSRRRRSSRSAATSPQTRGTKSTAASPARRASIAVSPVEPDRTRSTCVSEIIRSPRHSIIPDISLESQFFEDEIGSVNEDVSESPRPSLAPSDLERNPRTR